MSTKHATHSHTATDAPPEEPQPQPPPPPETRGISTYQCNSTVQAAVDDQVFWNTKIIGA